MEQKDSGIVQKKGMSFIEIFITLGILAVISAVILLIVNPRRRKNDFFDLERKNEIQALMDAISLCTFDNNGVLPQELESIPLDTYFVIGNNKSECDTVCNRAETQKECLRIQSGTCGDKGLLVPNYITKLPIDPDQKEWNEEKTGYYIGKISSDTIKIGSCASIFESVEVSKKYK